DESVAPISFISLQKSSQQSETMGTTDIEALHADPSDAPEQLRTDVAELVGVADYESAKYKFGKRKTPITECTCSRCRDR
ncbi:hypothetical protein, partial [Halobellus sp. EA9]|uniref:hypothetical protein n=1 Tax=Halobellus sp. EA9 TaxID=3421647 RepID=UPI003EB8A48E